jgi:alcohol dehydrogenase
MTEPVPLDRTDEAYQKMVAGKARFRMVLTAG